MKALLTSSEDEHRAPKRPLRASELLRLMSLAKSQRGRIAVGLVATVLFALFRSMSIGGALPIFKILLGEEGLPGWVDRVVAGKRVGAEFEELDDPAATSVLITKVRDDAGWSKFDRLADPSGRPVSELLRDIAAAQFGEAIEVTITPHNSPAAPKAATIHPGEVGTHWRLTMWAAARMPAGGTNAKLQTLAWLLGGLVFIIMLSGAFRYAGEVLLAHAIIRTMIDLRTKLYTNTLKLPMSFFATQPTADLVTRFVQDVQEVQRGMLALFGKFIREPLQAVFILTVALLLDWRVTLAMLVVTPLAVVIFLAVGRSVKSANKKLLQAYGAMIDALTTSLQNLRVVKTYTAEASETARLAAVDRTIFKQQLKLTKLQAFTSPMMEIVAVVAASGATLWLASLVLQHEIEVSEFLTLGLVLSTLFDPLRKLSDVYVRVQRSTAGSERIFQVIDAPSEGEVTPATAELEPLKRAIEFLDVSFTYPGAVVCSLAHVNLTISQGETVAIVGPNGCGKTTLVSMLPRLFEPDEGEIRYDGVDMRTAILPTLRKQISMVSQEATVFAGTPIENIAYGHSHPDLDRVKDAAIRASADEFIREIPGGYEARLGERGTTLSGGQRQRLAIARAIYRDAPILIFDEATSQIDAESELKIQTALREFAKDRTTIIIAHRLSTIQFAGRIVVMDAGRVIDAGEHELLFERCQLYRTLCKTQFFNGAST